MAAEADKNFGTARSTFSLISWNIDGLYQHDTFERTASVVETLTRLHPDVIYIQEIIPMTWGMLTHALGSTYHCLADNPAARYFHGIFVAKKVGIEVTEPLIASMFPGTQESQSALFSSLYYSYFLCCHVCALVPCSSTECSVRAC